MRRSVPILLAALAVACSSHDGPFTARGRPAKPLYEARAHCKAEARSVADDGAVDTNWNAYEVCMAELGWVKQSTSSGAGPGPTGGGSPSY